MPSKLRRLTTAKGLTPAELKLINDNWSDIEYALNTVGAATPGGGSASPGITDHGALSGLVPDDDHTQYLNILGRATNIESNFGGQLVYGADGTGSEIYQGIQIRGDISTTSGSFIVLGSLDTGAEGFVIQEQTGRASYGLGLNDQFHWFTIASPTTVASTTLNVWHKNTLATEDIFRLTNSSSRNQVRVTNLGSVRIEAGQISSVALELHRASGGGTQTGDMLRVYDQNDSLASYFTRIGGLFLSNPSSTDSPLKVHQPSSGSRSAEFGDMSVGPSFYHRIFKDPGGANIFAFEKGGNVTNFVSFIPNVSSEPCNFRFNGIVRVEPSSFSAGLVSLQINPSSSQTANITEWYDTSDIVKLWVTSAGVLSGDGSGLTGVVPAAHTHAETDIIDGSILARLAADEDITGQWDFNGQVRINEPRTLTTYPYLQLRTTASASGVDVVRLYDKANALAISIDQDGVPTFAGGGGTGRSVKFYANDGAWPFFQIGSSGTPFFAYVEDLAGGGILELSVSGSLTGFAQLVLPAVGGSVMTSFSTDFGIANKTFSGTGNVVYTGGSTRWVFKQFTSITKQGYFAFPTSFPVSTTRQFDFPNRDGQLTLTTGISELSGQTGSVGATTIYATPSATPRLYRVSVYLLTTTQASAADTVQVNVIYTAGGNVHTRAVLLNDSGTTLHALNVANDDDSGHLVIYGDTSTNIQFSTTFTNNGGGDGAYFVAAYVEAI